MALPRVHSSSLLLAPSTVGRDKVPVTVFEPVQLLDEFLDPVIASQRSCVLLGHRDCDRVVFFAVDSLRVVWVVVLCAGSSVVRSRCWMWLCREADRHLSVRCSECSSSSTLALLFWQGVGVVRCRGGCSLFDCCGCDIEPTSPPSLRQSMRWSFSHCLVIGSSALWWVSCVGRVVVMLIGTSPSLSLWLEPINVMGFLHLDTSVSRRRCVECWGWVVLS